MLIVDHSGPDVAAGRPSHARHAGEALAWAQARRHAHALPRPLSAEDVPLMQAAGRTLARPVHAAAMLPGFDNAAMDGYAVRGPGPWRLTGRILAGGTPLVGLEPGEAAEVATGAAVPANADRVVEYEASRRSGDTVYASVGQRRHIRRAGEYAGTGEGTPARRHRPVSGGARTRGKCGARPGHRPESVALPVRRGVTRGKGLPAPFVDDVTVEGRPRRISSLRLHGGAGGEAGVGRRGRVNRNSRRVDHRTTSCRIVWAAYAAKP